MKSRLFLSLPFALTLTALFSPAVQTARGALFIYSDRAEWEAAVSQIAFREDFESFTADVSFRETPLQVNGFSLSQLGPNLGVGNMLDVPPYSTPPATPRLGGSAGVIFHTQYTAPPFESATQGVIKFDWANYAFGFDYTGASRWTEFRMIRSDGGTTGFNPFFTPDGFVGYVLTEGDFNTAVELLTPFGETNNYLGMDNAAGASYFIPEPSGAVLGVLGGAAGLLSRRSRRR